MRHVNTVLRLYFTVVFCFVMLAVRVDAAPLLVSSQPTNPGSRLVERNPANTQAGGITTRIDVGPSNVLLDSFGTFGQLLSDGLLKWVVFDETANPHPPGGPPVFSTAAIPSSAAGSLQWYDSPSLNLTLLANHTYFMGVISNESFVYSTDRPGVSVSGGGLTFVANSNGNTEDFNAPVDSGDNERGAVTNSFRAFCAVPEPSAFALAAFGILGLLIAARRKR